MNPSFLTRLRAEWAPSIPRELLAGAVATFALIPEVIAFSFVAGVDPSVGLFASFVISLVIAFTGGRPAMVSAAAGSVALVAAPLVQSHGLATCWRRGCCRGRAGGVWVDEAGRADALCVQLGAHGFRECAGHPDLCRAAAASPRRQRSHLGRAGAGAALTACRGWASGWHGLRCP
jgi:hypothetical protein